MRVALTPSCYVLVPSQILPVTGPGGRMAQAQVISTEASGAVASTDIVVSRFVASLQKHCLTAKRGLTRLVRTHAAALAILVIRSVCVQLSQC